MVLAKDIQLLLLNLLAYRNNHLLSLRTFHSSNQVGRRIYLIKLYCLLNTVAVDASLDFLYDNFQSFQRLFLIKKIVYLSKQKWQKCSNHYHKWNKSQFVDLEFHEIQNHSWLQIKLCYLRSIISLIWRLFSRHDITYKVFVIFTRPPPLWTPCPLQQAYLKNQIFDLILEGSQF